MGKVKYSEQQIQILRDYYPQGDWDNILPYFPNTSKVNIRATAKRFGIYRDMSNTSNRLDLTGMKYGRLTVIVADDRRDGYWKCLCDCGKETTVRAYTLISGGTKSCGCLKRESGLHTAKDFTGMKFGMLTAVERIPRYNGKETYYRCTCDCGKTNVMVKSGNLRSGHTTSCGVSHHKKFEYWNIKHPYTEDGRKYLVYRHIAPNGKSYIGITKQNADRRFQKGIGYKTQVVFWRAIEKYGWENFQHEIVEENLSEKEACEKEEYYIKEIYHTIAPNGYNVSEGGNTGLGLVKPILQYYNGKVVNFFEGITYASKYLCIAQDTIKRHFGADKAVRGYYFEQLPPIHTYDIPDQYWEIVDEAHYDIRKAVSEATREITIARNLKGSKPINQYSLDGKYIKTYPSIEEAKRRFNNGKGEAISAAVNPNRQGETAYGYMWRYDSGNHDDILPVKYKVQKAVLQVDTATGDILGEFKSMAEAARAFDTSISIIRKQCEDNQISFTGYRFAYKN